MNSVTRQVPIPSGSNIANGFETVDYHDTYRVRRTTDRSAEEMSGEIFRLPRWARFLLRIRNRVAGIFGLKTGKGSSGRKTFFTLIENSEDEIVMGENDRHLNFRTSIMVHRTEGAVSLTTIVHFNNVWGRIYFFPVKPFHKMLMRTLLKKSSQ